MSDGICRGHSRFGREFTWATSRVLVWGSRVARGGRKQEIPESGSERVRVFGEGVKSARGEIAILDHGDHIQNMFGTSLHTTYCK